MGRDLGKVLLLFISIVCFGSFVRVVRVVCSFVWVVRVVVQVRSGSIGRDFFLRPFVRDVGEPSY